MHSIKSSKLWRLSLCISSDMLFKDKRKMSSSGDVIRTFSATFTFPELLLFMILSLAVENKELRKLKGYKDRKSVV